MEVDDVFDIGYIVKRRRRDESESSSSERYRYESKIRCRHHREEKEKHHHRNEQRYHHEEGEKYRRRNEKRHRREEKEKHHHRNEKRHQHHRGNKNHEYGRNKTPRRDRSPSLEPLPSYFRKRKSDYTTTKVTKFPHRYISFFLTLFIYLLFFFPQNQNSFFIVYCFFVNQDRGNTDRQKTE
jgi:hypothetical protein